MLTIPMIDTKPQVCLVREILCLSTARLSDQMKTGIFH